MIDGKTSNAGASKYDDHLTNLTYDSTANVETCDSLAVSWGSAARWEG